MPWLKKMFFGFLDPYVAPYSKTSESSADQLPPVGSESAAALEEVLPIEEAAAQNYELVTAAAGLENGMVVFQKNCLACHGPNGEGTIGPNLTDTYWINGDGSLNTIVKVIQVGVPVKGMIPWKGVLSDKDILDVSSHVYNLQGTNPANPKSPQGVDYGE